jgi:hypothetical protein
MEGTAVTEEERALYLRSILRDEAVFLEVQVESLGISIRFKSRSNYENDIIYASIAKDQAEGAIAGIPEYLSRASRYTACVSLDRFGDLPFPRPDFTDTTIPLHKRVDELRDVFKKHMLSMSASKWGLVEVAGRMFERKLALCHDNILNRDFWNPAGAG